MPEAMPTARFGRAFPSASVAAPITQSITVIVMTETATGGCAHTIDPRFARRSIARMTPAFICMGGKIEAIAMKVPEVVPAIVPLMPESAGPSLAV